LRLCGENSVNGRTLDTRNAEQTGASLFFPLFNLWSEVCKQDS
jgi:hypothetical protein